MRQEVNSRMGRVPRLAAAAAIVLILAMVTALAPVSAANLIGSNFESDDGNLIVNGGAPAIDWTSVAESRQSDKPTGSGDDSFGQGSKEDTAVPSVVSGSIPNNKSDLKTFGVYAEKTGSGKNLLHMYWTRVQAPTGTTNMDFEFNQSSQLSGNGVTPVRTPGDLLIAYDLAQGGTVPIISVHFWTGSAWGPKQDLSAVGSATGSINLAPIAAGDSDGLGALDALTFGEASVDLDAIFPAGTCAALGSAYLKSRSSDSFTAALKDFIAPIPVNISNCGTIVIRKVTDPSPDKANPATFFGYSTTGGLSPANFSLANDTSQSYLGVQAGSYSVTEAVDSRYELHSLVCTVSGAGTSATPDLATATVEITLAAGGSVDCTYTNDYKDHILVDKVTIPAGDPQVFAFSLTGGPDNLNQGFNLADQTVPYDSGPLSSGPGYSVTEIVPDGWKLTSKICTENGLTFPPENMNLLASGNSILCTFTNTKLGKIIIVKETDPNGSPQVFTFTPSYGAAFNLKDGESNTSEWLEPGFYSVVETQVLGWEQPNAVCSDGSPANNIDLGPGETVTCTFNNTQKFVTVVLVCEQGPGTLYPSAVNNKTSLTQAQMLTAGFTAAQIQLLCGLNQGAQFSGLHTGAHNYAVTIP